MKKRTILQFLIIVFFGLFRAYAQEITVKGKVTKSTNKTGLSGVLITIKETSKNILTDTNGNYQIKADANNTLIFSSTGVTTQEIPINNQTIINIALQGEQTLSEVVVVGYGTLKKSDVTGAVSSVKAENLTKFSSSDVVQSLGGQAAGVNVINTSGEPGSGAKIRIRGIGTINQSDPLYVVDGFPVGDISFLAPNDIESMEILKDASATAIYGSRGANGVVLIKTKLGKIGQKTQIRFNTFTGVSKIPKYIKMVNAKEFSILKIESMTNDNQQILAEDKARFNDAILNNKQGTDWQKEITQVGFTQNYNLSFSGGSEKNAFDAGITYANEEGIIKNTFMKKLVGHLNNEYKLFDKVKWGLNLSVSNIDKRVNNTDFYSGALTQALKADPISLPWNSTTNNYGHMYYTYGINPAQSVDYYKYNNQNQKNLLANTYININDIFIKDLSFRAQYGYQYSISENNFYEPQYYISANEQNKLSSLREERPINDSWLTNAYFNYIKNIGGKHNINITLGTEAQRARYSYVKATDYGVPEEPNLRYLNNNSNKTTYNVEGISNFRSLQSVFVRLNYSYDNRYLITFTDRQDWASTLAPKHRSGNFSSFGLGWNVMNENFMSKTKSTINLFKIRAGWGQVGNQNSLGYNDYASLMTAGYAYPFGGKIQDGYIHQAYGNDNLSWERNEQTNLGFDFGFFNNNLTATIDLFDRKTKDMIQNVPVDPMAGKWRTNANIGTIENKGIEFTVNYRKKINQVGLEIGFNITPIKNKVTKLDGFLPGSGIDKWNGGITRTEEGREIGYFYGYKTAGIIKTKQELDVYKKSYTNVNKNTSLGDVIFVDTNNDGKIDDNDKVYLGSAMPKFTYGFNIGFNYKNFDIITLFQGSYGNKAVNAMDQAILGTGMTEWSIGKEMMGRWTPENPNSNLPRLVWSDPNNNVRFSDRFIQDASYLRMRNLQVGYSLPKDLTQRLKINRFRIYLAMDNIFVFTKYKGYDPAISDLHGNALNPGVDMGNYPVPRVFTIGINTNF